MGTKKNDATPELPKSVLKNLPTGWSDEADAMSSSALRDVLVDAETKIREVEVEMAADEKLAAAKEIVKDLAGAYREVTKAQRAKIAYALHLLDERGELG